ncbi:hypothetical protein HYPSUDRAFT_202280 [Hypholoma sublateritium FD-334 SS-4]|uniref:Uncharacterized protein n=1 Tax=Hypholoma sublateritium (strain FD-334 SS-4) TaxID=945553 RepID=A0A0D2PQY6_HYPSF|nr:hypothetical protein HYPSUDRAFT_202280 [Hypholoma sublateritium FD-334 SS-4]
MAQEELVKRLLPSRHRTGTWRRIVSTRPPANRRLAASLAKFISNAVFHTHIVHPHYQIYAWTVMPYTHSTNSALHRQQGWRRLVTAPLGRVFTIDTRAYSRMYHTWVAQFLGDCGKGGMCATYGAKESKR